MEKLSVVRTKKGLPALWEEGGGFSNTGRAYIVAGPNGEPLIPVYIRRKGPLACEEHALFIIKEGYHFIYAYHHRRDFTINVYKIIRIDEKYAEAEKIAEFSQGEWDRDPPEYLNAAIEAAKRKATMYHCRVPVYYTTPE